jgi:hypothetical protein
MFRGKKWARIKKKQTEEYRIKKLRNRSIGSKKAWKARRLMKAHQIKRVTVVEPVIQTGRKARHIGPVGQG